MEEGLDRVVSLPTEACAAEEQMFQLRARTSRTASSNSSCSSKQAQTLGALRGNKRKSPADT